MKHRDSAKYPTKLVSEKPVRVKETRKRHRFWRRFGIFLLVVIVVAGIGRAMLPWMARDYVNRTLDRNPLYSGKIGELKIHLWRGAYSIADVNISKTTGNVPVPFFAAKRVEFALLWKALFQRRAVGRVLMVQPELNFVDAQSEAETQTGAGGPWLGMIKDLFPFKINTAVIQDGSVHFRTYQKEKPVDVYLSHFEATIDNLGNIRNETSPLPATVRATALMMDEAKFEFNMTLDPFSYRPTFHMATRLVGLDLTKINDLARTYGKFDFERGWFDLVIETDSKEGQVTGYVKPLFRNPKIFSLIDDIKDENALELFWQALVGTVTNVLKNRSRDQFGTLIPFSGDASGSNLDIFAALGNILRNAFIRAYMPRLENGGNPVDGLQFQPPDVSDPISGDVL
ncbi:MAG: DUF748 domain-containing protein [Verrucomicrobiota bacterium]